MKKEKKQKSRAQKKGEEIAKQWQYDGKIKSDVYGSYTGTPDDPKDTPLQDVDDL